MKILFIGDISGRPGRETVKEVLPDIRQQYSPNLVVANIENAAGGRGVTRNVLNELTGFGIDYFTSGEHVWDLKEFHKDMQDRNLPLVRPYNYEGTKQLPGKGYSFLDMGREGRVLIINLLGTTFMRSDARNPMWVFDELWEELKSRGEVTDKKQDNLFTLVDFHAEATSDKLAFAYYVRNRVHAVVGTHTHVATADNRILYKNLAYVTDVGMVGPYQASLWVNFESVIQNYKYPMKTKFEMEFEGKRVFNSVLIEYQKEHVKRIERVDKVIG